MHDDDLGEVTVVRTDNCSVGLQQQLANMICTAMEGFWIESLQSVFDRHCRASVLDKQKPSSSLLLLLLLHMTWLLIHSFDVTLT